MCGESSSSDLKVFWVVFAAWSDKILVEISLIGNWVYLPYALIKIKLRYSYVSVVGLNVQFK